MKRVILYLLHSGNLYGTERMALATLAGLDEYDKRVVFAPKPYGVGSVAEAARSAGFDAVTFSTRRSLIRQLLPWFVRYRSIDAICTGVVQSFVCHGLSKLTFVKLRQLQVVHGGTEESHAYGRKRVLNRIPVRIVAVSRFVEGKLRQYGVRPETISVIENFLSDAQRKAYGRRPSYIEGSVAARPIDRARVRVAVVSRLDTIKRLHMLVQAIESHGLADFEFDVYGTGSDIDILKQRSAGLRNIRFHGYVPDVNARLPEADFLLHLCPEEPFGLVILEAFVTGLVVIVPDSGGAGSLVDDGITGLRFAADDVEELVRVLRRAGTIADAALQRMANAASQCVDQRYSQGHGVKRYRQALQQPVGVDGGSTRS